MKDSKFIPTREQWDEAGRTAERRHPYPATSTALAAAYGLFGGVMAAVIVLGLHGIDPSAYPGRRTVALTGTLCGIVGYLAMGRIDPLRPALRATGRSGRAFPQSHPARRRTNRVYRSTQAHSAPVPWPDHHHQRHEMGRGQDQRGFAPLAGKPPHGQERETRPHPQLGMVRDQQAGGRAERVGAAPFCGS